MLAKANVNRPTPTRQPGKPTFPATGPFVYEHKTNTNPDDDRGLCIFKRIKRKASVKCVLPQLPGLDGSAESDARSFARVHVIHIFQLAAGGTPSR